MRFLPLLPLILLLAACTQPAPSVKEMSFTRYQPIHLDVEDIAIIDEYTSPGRPPNVEHLMPISPSEAMHIWVKDRLRAVGGSKTLQVIIKNAAIVSTELPKPEGISGVFTASQDRRYDAKLEVEMRVYGGRAMSNASIRVTATRYITVSEKASVAERQRIFRRMVAELMESINGQLEKNMFAYFKDYIVYSQSP